MSDRELMDQRHIDNARRWEEAKRSFKWQVKIFAIICLIIVAIFAARLLYLNYALDACALRNSTLYVDGHC